MESKFEGENPIKHWIFEIVPVHGGAVSREDRIDQMEEVVDRLVASTSISIEESFDYAKEARTKFRRMGNEAVAQDALNSEEINAVMNAFDRMVTAWIQSPTEIQPEVEEIKGELNAMREG